MIYGVVLVRCFDKIGVHFGRKTFRCFLVQCLADRPILDLQTDLKTDLKIDRLPPSHRPHQPPSKPIK